ncbi:MAG: DUF58 domain-containing protein, partial [Actinomycetota bacterium]|nr:DUF58 domain-containing protein [Actinomycetota bacterium]
ALAVVIEYYGTASEVPWLFLLSNWIIAFIVVSLAYAWWNERGLRLHLRVSGSAPAPSSPTENLPEHLLRSAPVPAPIFEGDGLDMEIGLDTTRSPRGPARLTGFIGSEPLRAATGLVPRSGWRHQVALQGLRRGPVGAHSWVVESSDPLGLFRSRRTSTDAEVALVLPRFTSIAHRPQTRELEASVAAPRSGSGTELFGVREYRPGDSLRRIHWRSSARHGELVVREYEPPGVQTLGIFCDPSPATPEVADQVARLAASEAWDCIRSGGRVRLWGPGLVPTSSGEARSLWSLLEWLARYPALSAAGDDADPPMVSEAVAVTAGARQELVEALEMVRRRGGTVRAWVVGDADVDLDGPVQHVGTDWPL